MSREILFINPQDTTRHTASANAAIYPNIGLLTLMSNVEQMADECGLSVLYFDGTVHGNNTLESYIDQNSDDIAAACFSALTSNYGAAVSLSKRLKNLNPEAVTIFGNDHFSAVHKQALNNQPSIDYGFYGNDVVTSFSKFLIDKLTDNTRELASYPGLVFRQGGEVARNPEDPSEYGKLALINYGLVDTLLPHNDRYLEGQQNTYFFMRDRKLKSQIVDIGRGCIKFSGARTDLIPANACDFCAIIPGSKEIVAPQVSTAWEVLRNAYDQGFNYFYVTADELPLTMWPLLMGMANNIPEWFKNIPDGQKPKLFGYARAEGFATRDNRIDVMVNELGFDHFFIGFDGLSELSLRVMNKQPVGGRAINLMEHNLTALEGVVKRQGMITAGIVLTHLGITPQIMEKNHQNLIEIVSKHPRAFAALDFGPLCPIPGSMSFQYFLKPEIAEKRANEYGLTVDREYLESKKGYYLSADIMDMDELIDDFTLGCSPDVDSGVIELYLQKTTELAEKNGIVVGGGV